jgi:hypothetical protein
MDPTLNPIDQLIAARIKARFSSLAKRADPIDTNDYPRAIQSLKEADSILAGVKTTTSKYNGLAKKALDAFTTAVDKIPSDLEKLGVSSSGIKKSHTQLVNLIKVAKAGQPLRAYSTFSSDKPLNKVKSVIESLVRAALKSAGTGTKVLKPALVANCLGKVMDVFDDVRSACDDWYAFVGGSASSIDQLVMDAWWLQEEPHSSGFTLTEGYTKYVEAQRVFAKQNRELLDVVRHNVIGLPMASTKFEDCEDVDLCINTASKTLDEALKLNLDFGKKWGDFRAKNQDQSTGQKSLFAGQKTRLDLILDRVRRGKEEVTIDTKGYTKEQVERILEAAKARKLHASYDGRFVLVR